MVEEKFPYKSDYYHLVEGKTISKRGVWWTAALLVQSVSNADDRKVVIQRWQKTKRASPDVPEGIVTYWAPKKNFTFNNSKHYYTLKEIVDEWLGTKAWE